MTKTRALELVDEIERLLVGTTLEQFAALRLAITQIPTTHIWVPIAECGELADGVYIVRAESHWPPGMYAEYRKLGPFQDHVTHVLSPHLGPIPEEVTVSTTTRSIRQSCNNPVRRSTQ